MTEPTAQIVAFPFQVREDGTHVSELTDDEAFWRARHDAAWILNHLATGQVESISEEIKQCIRTLNAFCLETGYPPIDCDF